MTLTCDFNDVPVNTYSVVVDAEGGYYKSQGEDVFTVYDPSLGFTTGGGWFYWPGTDEKTNFGYTMKYNKKGTKVQGSLLLIRHPADGTIYRVKSNALEGLALGESKYPLYGWASFSGKATYKDPAYEEYPEPVGNHTFVVYVEDWDEPGTGIDQFWIEVMDGDGMVIPIMSMDGDAVGNTVGLKGGNIVVPHNSGGKKQGTAELKLFTVEAKGENVHLTWETASEVNIRGFNLYRASTSNGPWEQANSVLLPTGTKDPTIRLYKWVEKGTGRIGNQWYLLDWLSTDGFTGNLGITSKYQISIWIPIVNR
jgi:hypothetical protein